VTHNAATSARPPTFAQIRRGGSESSNVTLFRSRALRNDVDRAARSIHAIDREQERRSDAISLSSRNRVARGTSARSLHVYSKMLDRGEGAGRARGGTIISSTS